MEVGPHVGQRPVATKILLQPAADAPGIVGRPGEANLADVEERLAALLWSGEAA
ncbi:MAG: hypothetical protein ACKON8_10805 [Planctomycetota bacterium]